MRAIDLFTDPSASETSGTEAASVKAPEAPAPKGKPRMFRKAPRKAEGAGAGEPSVKPAANRDVSVKSPAPAKPRKHRPTAPRKPKS